MALSESIEYDKIEVVGHLQSGTSPQGNWSSKKMAQNLQGLIERYVLQAGTLDSFR